MALGRDIVDAIIREHSYRPIAGEVLVIGHQTVNLSRNEVLELMREHHVATASGATLACQKRAGSKTAQVLPHCSSSWELVQYASLMSKMQTLSMT